MSAYSIDLRERVLADFDAGMGNDAVAKKYRVSSRWVYKLRRQRSETGQIAPRRGKTGPQPKLAAHVEQLVQLVEERPDATLNELRQKLGVSVSLTTLWTTLKKLGLTLKKVLRAVEQDRPDVAQRRTAWRYWQAHLKDVALARADWRDSQAEIDPERLVFVDETGLKTDISRLRGWAAGGERLVEAVPGGHWRTSTLVQAVGLDGTRAAMVLDGPINSLCFTGFCEHFLAPTLRPGDLVVLDNLSSHKSSAAVAAIEGAGARLVYLPPYSPDLNPIENLFSKIKQLIRGFRPHTWRQIILATKHALRSITYEDIANTFLHCGYEAT